MKHYLVILLSVLSIFITTVYASDNTKDDSYNSLLDEKFYDDIDFSKITEENVVSAMLQANKQTIEEYKKIANNEEEASFENTVVALYKVDIVKNRLEVVVSFLENFHSSFFDSDKLEELAKKDSSQEEESKLVEEMTEIYKKLLKRLDKVYEKKNLLNEEDQKLLEIIYRKFNSMQITLSEDQIVELNKIDSELNSLKKQFTENLKLSSAGDRIFIQKDDKDIDNKLKGIPENSLDSFENEAKAQNIKEQGYLITYQNPKTIDVLIYAYDRKLRQQVYEILVNHAKELNSKIVIDIMNIRLKKAKLLGLKNYAEYAFKTSSMVKTPQNAIDFLNKIKESTLEKSKQKYEELLKFAREKENDPNFEIQAWDFAYYLKQQQEAEDVVVEALKPYFELSHVRDGIFTVLNKLYGVSFTKKDDVSLYYKNNKDGIESVEVFEVTDKDGSYLGRLYLDYFPRQGKREGGFTTTIRMKELKSDNTYTPTTVAVCINFSSQPTDGKVLLSVSDVITLFHEMGHAMNFFFMKTKYIFLSSPDIDIGELPSQILEKWAFEKEVLSLYAKHYKTGEDIPESLIKMTNKKQDKTLTLKISTTVFFDMMDLDWHLREEEFPTEGISNEKYMELENDFEKKEWEKYGYAPNYTGYLKTYNISHIIDVGYESRLYNYLWSEMLVEQAFEKFKEKGNIFDKDVAESFRENILSIGVNKDPLKAYQKFIGTTDIDNIRPLLKKYGIDE